MINYIKAELYRTTHKKSMYMYYAALVLGFLLIIIFASNMDATSYLEILGLALVSMTAVFVAGQVFMSVYGDDVSSKSLGLSVSTGLSRTKIIIAKFIVSVVLVVCIYFVLSIVAGMVYLVLGGNFSSQDQTYIRFIFFRLAIQIVVMLVFMVLTTIVLYTSQSSTASSIVLILLIMGFVYNILGMISSGIPFVSELMPYTVTALQGSINDAYMMKDIVEYSDIMILLGYLVAGLGLSSFALGRKELSN